jgi:hypothetical protein
MAEKVTSNDEALTVGTLPEVEVGVLVLDEVDEPLLPQPAATRAPQAATAVRAIVLLLIKPNETTSF